MGSDMYTEIERATDNLVKSGKWMAGIPGPGRRDSMPVMGGRSIGDFGMSRQQVVARRSRS